MTAVNSTAAALLVRKSLWEVFLLVICLTMTGKNRKVYIFAVSNEDNAMSYSKYVFSGHESFLCKTLWLKKGYDFVVQGKDFNSPEAVIDLGVEKIMVASIRYWLRVIGVCENDQPTWLGYWRYLTRK